jgi:hypothetical protein
MWSDRPKTGSKGSSSGRSPFPLSPSGSSLLYEALLNLYGKATKIDRGIPENLAREKSLEDFI